MTDDTTDIWDRLDFEGVDHIKLCSVCQVAMEVGSDILFCPQCQQEERYDLGTALQPAAGCNVVLTTGGVIRVFNKTETDKHASLVVQYERILQRVSSQFVFPNELISRAVDILLLIQDASTTNRGRHLSELMAGSLFASACEAQLTITETAMAKIFGTRGGLSRGKNAVLTLLVKEHSLSGTNPRAYLLKDPKRLAAQFIKERMNRVGIWNGDKLLYTFIKCLVKFEDLYCYIDTQIINAKVAGSIYYFSEHCIVGNSNTSGIPLTLQRITSALSISAETIYKYYDKLRRGDVIIAAIAKILNIPMREPAQPVPLGRKKRSGRGG